MTALEIRNFTMNALEQKREEILKGMFEYYKNSTSYYDFYVAIDTEDFSITSGEIDRNNNFIDKSLVIFYRLNLDSFQGIEVEKEEFLEAFSWYVFDDSMIPNLQDTLLEIEAAEEEERLYQL